MAVGIEHKGEVWTDVLGWEPKEVTIGDDGFGEFDWYVTFWQHHAMRRTDLLTYYCDYSSGTSCAIYVNKDAKGRDRFGKFDDDIYKK